jgi:oligoribonuclease NrnB/cAMP/cGMP phosphodiesterase (DHH superfamily)
MEDRVIDDESLPLERKSLLPGEGFFIPDEIRAAREDREVEAALEGARTVVVADPDADGLACVAMVRETFGGATLVPAGPNEIAEALGRVAEYGDPERLFVCDLCPDDPAGAEPALSALADRATVRWFDHHQWEDAAAAAVRGAGVDLAVGGEDECTADVALRQLGDLPERFADLAAATRDHDLWIKEDPRSGDLADYAYWTDTEQYVETVREHGADLPAAATDLLAERRVEKEALVERAADRKELREVGTLTVGLTYGRCSQNEVADELKAAGADVAVVVKPSGSASLRGSDAFERCHEVARRVNGGGHPRAAGCKPDVYDDMLDYAHHWASQGAVAKQVILEAVRNLPDDDSG